MHLCAGQKRWFTLFSDGLEYFEHERGYQNGEKAKGTIALSDLKGSELATKGKGSDKHCRFNVSLHSTDRVYELIAPSATEAMQWHTLLCAQIGAASSSSSSSSAAAASHSSPTTSHHKPSASFASFSSFTSSAVSASSSSTNAAAASATAPKFCTHCGDKLTSPVTSNPRLLALAAV
jgi:hypothetical protein